MRCPIRPRMPSTPREGERLQRWPDEQAERSADAARWVQYRAGVITVEADEDLAHDLALATMAVIGRPFHYALAREDNEPQTQPAA